MTQVRVATRADLKYLTAHERIPAKELAAIVEQSRVLIAEDPELKTAVGWLRWGLLWDEVPFMNRLHIAEGRRRGGLGRLLVNEWESRCRDEGHALVMTSTLSDEQAQHFHRNLAYHDAGCLLLPDEALEIIFAKSLR